MGGPLGQLVQSAERVVGNVDDSERVGELVRQAETNKVNTQKLVEASPGGQAERKANEIGDEIKRLAKQLAGTSPLELADYLDTSEARRDQDPSLHTDDLSILNSEDLLVLASRLEDNINRNFEDLRTSQLAARLNLPLSQAMEGMVPSGTSPRACTASTWPSVVLLTRVPLKSP